MGTASNTLYYLVHPSELRAILQWKIWHQPVHERDEETEAITLRRCFDFLDKTSRSFAAVIKELHPELLVPICIFYLILRGMDTIEDDMTIAIDEKEPILRSFDKVLEMDGWTYEGNHSKEKDRDLLVQFHYVITEFKKIKPEFREVISDITNRMGNGMADYCVNAEQLERGVETIKEYELYCHHVAGLVGEGLTRLFIICGRANPALIDRPDLTESMGQFLQQTNIIRDIKEDNDEKRRFWPKEVWSKYVDNFGDLLKPEYREKALQCSSEMVLLALERAPDCLFYLAGMKDQSVFNFTAIPQIMAIATLELVYRNPDIFERNVKITKGQACGYMIESSQNLQILYKAFVTVARRIHKKSDPRDPNFLKISIACGRIEQFVESVFASQGPNVIVGTKSNSNQTGAALADDELNRQKKADAEAKKDTIYLVLAMLTVLLFVVGTMIIVAQYFGARFDLIYKQLLGTLTPEEQLIIDTRFPPKKSHNEL